MPKTYNPPNEGYHKYCKKLEGSIRIATEKSPKTALLAIARMLLHKSLTSLCDTVLLRKEKDEKQ